MIHFVLNLLFRKSFLQNEKKYCMNLKKVIIQVKLFFVGKCLLILQV